MAASLWLIIGALVITNVALIALNLQNQLLRTSDPVYSQYSASPLLSLLTMFLWLLVVAGYIDDDFPVSLPLQLKEVAMFVEDTEHYQLDDASEWATLFPTSLGFVHLGPEQVPFGLSMFHQLHCLDMIRTSLLLASQNKSLASPKHARHCLGYLRQMALCAADTHLEPVVPYLSKKAVDLSRMHRCWDWSAVYAELERNEKEWREHKKVVLRDE